ncbi:fumarylacetoacetate hydrolase [Humitalea rosea]|uniref:fumarylacetoacetase n=1 Tax=Humitalea rosea TaxID=990373 RepID=A0A2W7HZF4_9PROT|nr:fumarylacetoacetase [Humitalea rosea]PZW39428.1 fumarylacetoacetate hydrolase [Humitalea rosea]
MLDHTHAPGLRSFVTSANGHEDFPIQNLPLGVFSTEAGAPRLGVAIGDMVLDLARLSSTGLINRAATGGAALNAFFALGSGPRRMLRATLSDLLAEHSPHQQAVQDCLHPAADCDMHLPAHIGDYTDFYAGIQHAENVGRQFRPDNPLLPNYKYVPIGYHGRASSIVPSGTALHRPNGQRKPATETVPSLGPSRNLDYELELGIWIGPGNALGETIPIANAADHIAGYCLLNDWSARDIQGWEYQPLGPFLAKNFGSSISPWVITPEALAPFRIAQAKRPSGDPAPLPYLWDEADQAEGALSIRLDVLLMTPGLREKGLPPHRLGRSDARHLYWTPAQLVTHHASGGCNLRPGDLFGTGTISGPIETSFGSLLEVTNGGRRPVTLESGETRRFLEDGDEITLIARAEREGAVSIGFGPCQGSILPAR